MALKDGAVQMELGDNPASSTPLPTQRLCHGACLSVCREEECQHWGALPGELGPSRDASFSEPKEMSHSPADPTCPTRTGIAVCRGFLLARAPSTALRTLLSMKSSGGGNVGEKSSEQGIDRVTRLRFPT